MKRSWKYRIFSKGNIELLIGIACMALAIISFYKIDKQLSQGTPIETAYSADAYKSKIVYICTGRYAKSYHSNRYCKGLNNCSGKIESIALEEVEHYRKPCRICY